MIPADLALAQYCLVTASGPSRVFLPLRPPGPVTIGRHPRCTVVLADDPHVSREHAVLAVDPVGGEEGSGAPQWTLSDLHLLEHAPARDLSVTAADLSFDPTLLVRGQGATVRAGVRLAGDFVVDDVLVKFFDGHPAASGDIDRDGDVHGMDFGVFAGCFNGSGNPPACR